MSSMRKVLASVFVIALVAVTVLGTNVIGGNQSEGDTMGATVLRTVSALAGEVPTISAPAGAAG